MVWRMLKLVKYDVTLNKPPRGTFRRYNYYICTVFFHGIRFKVKDKTEKAVVRQPFLRSAVRAASLAAVCVIGEGSRLTG